MSHVLLPLTRIVVVTTCSRADLGTAGSIQVHKYMELSNSATHDIIHVTRLHGVFFTYPLDMKRSDKEGFKYNYNILV